METIKIDEDRTKRYYKNGTDIGMAIYPLLKSQMEQKNITKMGSNTQRDK